MAFVAAGIGCNLEIAKITRCSNSGSTIADALSQGRIHSAKQLASAHNQELQLDPAKIPGVLLAWLHRPVPDEYLGMRLLRLISQRFTVAVCYKYRC